MSDYQLAQLNIATLAHPADSPELADFMNNLDRVNAIAEARAVLWWIPAGTEPTLEDAAQRLAHLQAGGSTPEAFTFRDAFPAPALQ